MLEVKDYRIVTCSFTPADGNTARERGQQLQQSILSLQLEKWNKPFILHCFRDDRPFVFEPSIYSFLNRNSHGTEITRPRVGLLCVHLTILY